MRMNIRLKIMDQTDHPFEVDDQTLLSDFRLQVAERLHIPPDRQRMIFAGHVLKNENSTLSACGLRDGHVVHLVERPADMNPHIASPALERVSLILSLLDQIAHFHNIVEAEDGLVDRIDEFLEGTHVYDQENTSVMNEQVRAVALSLESESMCRSRLIDLYGSEEVGEDESDEHAARYQTFAETDVSPGFVMRHAITDDLVGILRRLRNEEEALHPHLIRFERILNSRILYNIDDAEHTDTDYRANFFTVYLEHIQRVLHRFSHAWHLASDLSVYLHTPIPRRLLPSYQQFRLAPPTEGEIVLEFHPTQEAASSEVTSNEPSWRFLNFPPPGVDVQELSNDEIRIIGMNPTIRRMHQMGIAVPIPVSTVGQTALESSNPYERIMRRLLQTSHDESVDISNVFRSASVQQALSRTGTRTETGTDEGSSAQHVSTRPPRAPVPSLGSLARGVITQSGGEMPFMSEVISNIMRNNGLGTSLPPQVDVIVEYGDANSHSGLNQGQPQLLNMAMGGIADANGRQPAAVGYHVEVHQFDIFSHTPEQEDTPQNSSQNDATSSAPTSSSTNVAPVTVSTPSTVTNDFNHSRPRQQGPPGFPFLMGGMNFPPEMHFTTPRQDIVNVDPFLSCASRFTDVQRVLRSSHPNVSSQLSPYRRLMGDSLSSSSLTDRRVTPVDAYERVTLALNSSGHVLMANESDFENFVQLAIRSALSQMVHTDQDRNSRASNGQQYDFIPRDEQGRNILEEMASSMTIGLDTRVTTILETYRAPASMLRPGNGAGVLAHLEALLLNFATLGDLANMINVNMAPLESHRAHFRAHVIENQLNGNSTPSAEDLLSASVRLAALISSISSVICAAGGELEREWNGRRMNISATIHNVEVATIQLLLRALLDRNISDAEFSHRIQNTLRDYVRHLVALGNHSFVSADQTAYVRIVYEILVSVNHCDAFN
ncbi:unnamed protein product [Haemonchus placei]|uniref:BCL2-associated athanogene 6 n=1 Tax=Haemonchus placei TaxID=6290 RepID=A0A158QLX9_HAEPC|nr:unnamed protein product [Haemonchus placei]